MHLVLLPRLRARLVTRWHRPGVNHRALFCMDPACDSGAEIEGDALAVLALRMNDTGDVTFLVQPPDEAPEWRGLDRVRLEVAE